MRRLSTIGWVSTNPNARDWVGALAFNAWFWPASASGRRTEIDCSRLQFDFESPVQSCGAVRPQQVAKIWAQVGQRAHRLFLRIGLFCRRVSPRGLCPTAWFADGSFWLLRAFHSRLMSGDGTSLRSEAVGDASGVEPDCSIFR